MEGKPMYAMDVEDLGECVASKVVTKSGWLMMNKIVVHAGTGWLWVVLKVEMIAIGNYGDKDADSYKYDDVSL